MRLNAFLIGVLLVMSLGVTRIARADGHGHGHDRDDDDRGRHYYSDHDRDSARDWYHDHDRDGHLPPGLAKRDQLPPGLERQLRVRGTLPPGLRKKMRRCPEEVEHRLPPPPRGCEHVVIGGHLVLVNRSTYVVMDIIHFEM
jgi:Ni/Co efflux regulator RcnB